MADNARMMKRGLWMLAVLAMLAPAAGRAEFTNTLAAARLNPLAGLPSKAEGPHIEKIKALADDSWLDLGSPAPDPKWGKGRGRAYSSKAAYAPDLSGAFFCGTGQHGYVKPDGHYMDDLFFYDANAHKWICLYPGASKETRLKVDEHGFEVTLDGEQNPVSYLSHAYNMVTYNTRLRKYMLINRPCPWWAKALPQRADWLEIPEKDRGNGYKQGKLNGSSKHPIFWNVDSNKWEHPFVADPVTPGESDCSTLEYVPEREQAFYLSNGRIFFHDFAGNKWIDAKLKVPVSYETVGCYDPKRSRVYIMTNTNLFAYGLPDNTWTPLAPASHPFARSTRGQLNFDAASGLVIGMSFHGEPTNNCPRGAYVYDPDKNTWSAPAAKMPEVRGVATAFYHAALNAHYVHIAGDSRDDGTMLVYRYRNASVEKAK